MANQSNVIFASLAIAFTVFITSKGELPNYISLLKGTKSASVQSATTETKSTAPSVNSVTNAAADLLKQSGISIPYPAPPLGFQ